MTCRPLKSIQYSYYKTPEAILEVLERELDDLAQIASETDFMVGSERQQFEQNVVYIKGYFEHYERLMRYEFNI